MITEIKAYSRNPHVLRKLIRFNGYLPANLIDKSKKTVAPVSLQVSRKDNLLRAGKDRLLIDYDGKKYPTRIMSIHMDEACNDIDEVELAVEY